MCKCRETMQGGYNRDHMIEQLNEQIKHEIA